MTAWAFGMMVVFAVLVVLGTISFVFLALDYARLLGVEKEYEEERKLWRQGK